MPDASESVTLPHRVPAPNTALWYAADIQLPRYSALEVDADDGAQVFVGGRLLQRHRSRFFVPPEMAGRRRVVVRVLNNAVQGGLRRVALVDARQVAVATAEPRPSSTAVARVESDAFRRRMPQPEQPCAFTAWADSHSSTGLVTFRRLVERMSRRSDSFTVGVGDLVSDGSDPAPWPALLEALMSLNRRMPIVAIAGNHDYDGYYNDLRARQYERWFNRADRTWFAWSCGPARLVAIDLNREFPIGISAGTDQRRWLEAETRSAAWARARWRILLVHQPPWSRSWPGYEGDEATRTIVEPLARDRGLDAVISGHSHAYEHLVRQSGSRQLHILITGGAGGTLEDQAAESSSTSAERIAVRHHFLAVNATRETLAVEAVDLDGGVFDRVQLKPR
jgi:predicted phosphodiesterase